jgi:hypothetical protein
MWKRNLFRLATAFVLSVLLLEGALHSQVRTITTAYQDLPNVFVPTQVFQQGLIFTGSSTGAITMTVPAGINNYALVLPSGGGITGYYLCIGSVAGAISPLAHCPASGGTGAPLISFSPQSLSFGSLTVGNTTQQSVLMTNTGNAQLTFSTPAVSISDAASADYAVATSPVSTCTNGSSLAGGATCKLYLSFIPSVVGERDATLNVSDNVTGSPQAVPLTGAGQ